MNQLGLSLLITFFASPSWSQQMSIKWSEGEHLELGIEGSTLACRQLGISAEKCPNKNIYREDKKYYFQYGEIVTSADYYNNPTEFTEDKKSAIAKVVKCAYQQKSRHAQQRKEDIEYPSCDTTGVFGIPGYLEVLSQNYNHFGWNNMVSYVDFHQKALQFAKKSYDLRETNPVQSRALFNKALIFNAYADHYLTDAFAAGHIRVPRIQIKEWARDELPGTLRSQRGDLLSMFLHNTESTDLHTHKEVGMRVQNSRGDVWLTRSDGHLNLFATEKDPALNLPRLAVAESFKDILIAGLYGDLPEGVFQATQFVPFENDMPLIDKLSPEHQKVKKNSDVAWLIFSATPMSEKFVFFKTDFVQMLDNMATIFIRFRQDVSREQQENHELKKRLPTKYLQSYLDVE